MPRLAPTTPAVLASCAALVLAIALPWSMHEGYADSAFDLGRALPIVTLGVVGVVVAALIGHVDGKVEHSTFRALTTLGVLLTAVAAAITLANTDHLTWIGPSAFAVAVVALAVSSSASGDAPARTGRERAVGVVITAGLALAVAALTGPWQVLTGDVVSELDDAGTIVFSGFEIDATLALRWVTAAAVLVVALLAAVPQLRLQLPVGVLAAGLAIALLSGTSLASLSVSGVGSRLAPGPGPWLGLAAGAVLAVTGAVALGARRRRAAAAVAVVAALAIAGLGGGSQVARAASSIDIVLAAGDGGRLGGPADRVDVGPAGSNREGRPAVAADADGGLWFVQDTFGTDHLLVQVVAGRALPATLVEGVDSLDLLGVTGRTAVVRGYTAGKDVIALVDLRSATARIDTEIGADDWSARTVLTSSATMDQPRSGEVDGSFTAELAADGSAVVRVDRSADHIRGAFRVPADQVTSGGPWRLTSATRIRGGEIAGPTGATYVPYFQPTALYRVPDADSDDAVVAGGVSDTRCTLSRDPLSSRMDGLGFASSTVAVDRAGDVWLAGFGHRSTGHRLLVRTRDGVLRDVPTATPTTHVIALTDGSVLVAGTSSDPIARIGDAAATARAATPLPAVAKGCVSENRVRVRTAGARVTRLAADPLDTVRLDLHGRSVTASLHALQLHAPGRPVHIVYRTAARTVIELDGDGRGGAWWLEEGDQDGDAIGVGHVDPSGRATLVEPLQHVSNPVAVSMAADPSDGSLWWCSNSSWYRTGSGGNTMPLHFDGTDVAMGGPARFGVLEDDASSVWLLTAAGDTTQRVIGADDGRGLSLLSGVAAHAGPQDYALSNASVAATPSGQLLVYQAGYLATVTRSGRVSLLAGPADGLPAAVGYPGNVRMYLVSHSVVLTLGDQDYLVDLP